MPLTQRENSELEELLEQTWGNDPLTLSSLLLDVADTSKLRKLLVERANDIESDDPHTASRLRYFARNLGGRVLSESPEATKRRERAAALRTAAETYRKHMQEKGHTSLG